ncbi:MULTISPECIES: LPXTG cell wall anchor domain-containing protein [Enterococcus]|uniref:LPXTG cell wall anchor domain-containing protein n=1 Tax=Enterococcus TaxID=1350 RepID=UPI00189FBF61|nr:LPXTG cell wall anchor domain-containing protein [Enterococcus dispar]MCU7356854.1 LPXTG cell wall anchor domain-containing protein [Enterococcus dispar]MDT2704955.1 LPXTG cell wall anchor domain-containing protein [Enterococcus dispar]WCG32578.1 LPXTG cell wall anchor domain-containing protein [Enterococcus dispar]
MRVKKVLGFLTLVTLLTGPNVYAAATAASVIHTSEVLATSSSEESTATTTTSSAITPEDNTMTTDTTIEAVEVGEAIKNGIEEQTGIPAAADNKTVNQNVSEIRNELASGQYNISAEQLGSYTDEQLDNALQIFTRVNQDFYGMDLGAYVRLLTALYQDKTVDVTAAKSALSFDPTSLSLAELKTQVTALQNYLQNLYPTNSSFIPIRQLSNDELVAILNFVTPLQEKMLTEEGRFFPGIVAWIARYASEGIPQARGNLTKPVVASTTETTNNSSNQDPSSKETGTTETTDSTKAATGILPKMGDNPMFYLSLIGLLVIIVVTFIFYRRKKK